MRAQILGPMGVDDVFVGHTLAQDPHPNEVRYDDPNLGLSAWDPRSNALTPFC